MPPKAIKRATTTNQTSILNFYSPFMSQIELEPATIPPQLRHPSHFPLQPATSINDNDKLDHDELQAKLSASSLILNSRYSIQTIPEQLVCLLPLCKLFPSQVRARRRLDRSINAAESL